MTEQEILEGNKLIAEFMQYNDIDCHECKHSSVCNHLQCGLSTQEKIEQFKFHSSWDWLMFVVQKVTKLIQDQQYIPIGKYQEYKEQYNIYEEQWRKLFDYQAYNFFKADIESIYKAMISFIEWYNHNIKNT